MPNSARERDGLIGLPKLFQLAPASRVCILQGPLHNYSDLLAALRLLERVMVFLQRQFVVRVHSNSMVRRVPTLLLFGSHPTASFRTF